MNAIHRIFQYVKAEVAQLSWGAVLTPVSVTLAFLVFSYYTNAKELNPGSSDFRRYLVFGAAATFVLLAFCTWLTSLIFTIKMNNRQFKEEANAQQVLTLPLSAGERYSAQMVLNLVFNPLVCSLLVFLTYTVVYYLPVEYLILPSPRYVWPAIPLGWTLHILTTSLWLTPAWSIGKKAIWVVLGAVLIGMYYVDATYGEQQNWISVAYEGAAVGQSDVMIPPDVILDYHSVTEKNAYAKTYTLRIDSNERSSTSIILYGLLVVLLYVSAYFALTRKTT